MSCGRRPKLIAAILANISYHKPFIHTPPKSLFTKRRGTFWEPDPSRVDGHARCPLHPMHISRPTHASHIARAPLPSTVRCARPALCIASKALPTHGCSRPLAPHACAAQSIGPLVRVGPLWAQKEAPRLPRHGPWTPTCTRWYLRVVLNQ